MPDANAKLRFHGHVKQTELGRLTIRAFCTATSKMKTLLQLRVRVGLLQDRDVEFGVPDGGKLLPFR